VPCRRQYVCIRLRIDLCECQLHTVREATQPVVSSHVPLVVDVHSIAMTNGMWGRYVDVDVNLTAAEPGAASEELGIFGKKYDAVLVS